MIVLLGELSKRVTMSGGRAVWTGFTQRPFDLRDFEGELAEFGLVDCVERHLANFDEDAQRRRDVFAAGLDRIDALRAAGDDAFVVLLCETGFEADVEASLVRLAGGNGAGRVTTIVVTPFPEKAHDVWSELAAPFAAQVVLDRRRARKGIFPSIDPLASLSDALIEDSVGARHVAAASRAKALLVDYAQLDPTFDRFKLDGSNGVAATSDPLVARADRLLAALRQPFLVAEPFTAEPARWSNQTEMLDAVERALDP
jgi:F0F1-type ATP synthase beta subunit